MDTNLEVISEMSKDGEEETASIYAGIRAEVLRAVEDRDIVTTAEELDSR